MCKYRKRVSMSQEIGFYSKKEDYMLSSLHTRGIIHADNKNSLILIPKYVILPHSIIAKEGFVNGDHKDF